MIRWFKNKVKKINESKMWMIYVYLYLVAKEELVGAKSILLLENFVYFVERISYC